MSSEGVQTRHYNVHGLSVAVAADRPEILVALHSRLRYFAVAAEDFAGQVSASAQPSADLVFTCLTVLRPEEHRLARPGGRSRPLFDFPRGEAVYFGDEDRLYLCDGERTRLLCEPAQGRAEVSILESELADLWVLSHPLFTVAFVELMKRRRRYSLHAAGLALDGRGLFLPGMSGAGKSTLTLALLRAGFGFMGDDRLFLSPAEDLEEVLTVQAFPDEIDVTDETASFFPELYPLLRRPKLPRQPKRQFWPEEFYDVTVTPECAPALLVFPRIAQRAQTALAPMPPEEALLELAPNVLLTDAASSQAHLGALAALVGASALYRLETGRDLGAVPGMLKELLASSPAP